MAVIAAFFTSSCKRCKFCVEETLTIANKPTAGYPISSKKEWEECDNWVDIHNSGTKTTTNYGDSLITTKTTVITCN